jgi:hypothetical protein
MESLYFSGGPQLSMTSVRRALGALGEAARGREGLDWLLPLLALLLLAGLGYTIMNLSWMIPIGMLGGIFGTLFFFIQPGISLLLFFALRIVLDLLWWVPGSFGGLNLLAAFTGGATALCGALFALEFRRIERVPTLNAFLLFLAVLGISAVRNLNLSAGIELLARFVSPPMMMFLVAAFLHRRPDADRMLKGLLIICAIPLVVSLFHLANGQMHRHTLAGYNRLLGGYKNLRHHGMMMMLMASLGGFWYFQARDARMKLIALVYAGASALCLYLTYIRTGLLAFAAFLVCFLYISQRRRELSLVLTLGTLVALLSPEIQDRFKDLVLVFTMSEEDMFGENRKLGSGRMGLWTDSFNEYLHQPLGDIILGLGLGKHWILTQAAYNPFVIVQDGQVDTHSDYLGLLYQLGPIALGCYLLMQARVVQLGYQLARSATDSFIRDLGAFAAALSIAVFVTNTISNGFVNRTTLGWFFWGVAGLMLAASTRAAEEQEEARKKAIPLKG